MVRTPLNAFKCSACFDLCCTAEPFQNAEALFKKLLLLLPAAQTMSSQQAASVRKLKALAKVSEGDTPTTQEEGVSSRPSKRPRSTQQGQEAEENPIPDLGENTTRQSKRKRGHVQQYNPEVDGQNDKERKARG
jgi:hypothetical protein